ncbi:MAG: adenylosuccinate lyase [Negativicutes bacterium]|nr:adenylosuccinate lyase [Negativicutes bacterium]
MIERYTRPVMAKLWSEDNRYQKWLEVELLAAEAWAELGVVPREAAQQLRKNARFDVRRIHEIEAETRHDVVAFTRCIAENLGEESKYLHYGLTSTDVVDTALSAVLKEAVSLIQEDLDRFAEVLRQQAIRYKDVPCMGRTHGVHAEPTTFGLKLALWYSETRRNIVRLARAKETIAVGKISGAVGTYANVDPFVERYVCEGMNLQPALISTQILQRDRHAELMTTLAIIASCLDKYATEIRGLQKTEIREVEEPFRPGQKGSSAMPHKRNPVNCEQVSGLARVIRGNTIAALEDIPLWHERDISHSSVERIILPDSTTLIDYLLVKFTDIVKNLLVYPKNMLRNIEKSHGLIHSQQVLLKLIEKGLLRETAYDLVQKYAMRAWEEELPFRDLISREPLITDKLSAADLDDCFDIRHHLKYVDDIFAKLGLV